MSANGSQSSPSGQRVCATLIRRKLKTGWIVRKYVCCQALASELCSITEVAEDWLIPKLAARFIINLLILKRLSPTVKYGINQPNKSCLMKRIKENYPSFNLFSIVGTWESINLNPTVIIYRSDKEYLFSIIYVSETTKQASPATYEIQQGEPVFYCHCIQTALYRL